MRITCVTSRYLPNLRHVARLAEVDQAVLLDLAPTPDRNRGSFVNRNRIQNRSDGQPLWLTVPILRRRGEPIGDVRISPTEPRWISKHCKALELNYPQHATVATNFLRSLQRALDAAGDRLIDVNAAALGVILDSIEGSHLAPLRQSEIVSSHARFHRLGVAMAVGATSYVAGEVEWGIMTASGEADEMRVRGIEVVASPPLEGHDVAEVVERSIVHRICGFGSESAARLLNDVVAQLTAR